MDSLKYEIHEKEQLRRFEDICKRCGECCGSRDGNPCTNLAQDAATEKYYCKIYEDRLGPQRTASGRVFNCISIGDIKKLGHLRPSCAYNKMEVI